MSAQISGYGYIPYSRSAGKLGETEAIHRHALAEARLRHDNVRDAAIRAYALNELKCIQENLVQIELQELERLRVEEENAAIAARVQELQKMTITIPPPRDPTPPPPAAKTKDLPQEVPAGPIELRIIPAAPANLPSQPAPTNSQPTKSDLAVGSNAPPELASSRAPQIEAPRVAPLQPSASQSNGHQAPVTSSREGFPGADEYVEIHKRLKQVRAFTTNWAKNTPAVKKKVGEMRREIRKSVGQLTEGKGANTIPLRVITGLLREARQAIESPPCDPRMVILSTTTLTEKTVNGGDELPILFIYLLNMFSKAIMAQFADETGNSTRSADPIAVVAVSTFAQAEFCWRGAPLIDILISKFRVACPVLFGITGNERTAEGRARIGWCRNNGGEWVSDLLHNTRMTGFGAGYAGISLRNFAKSKNSNPYPPAKYWQSLAIIVSTPPEQTSPTQFVVLKAMIENFEGRFLGFFGAAGKLALRFALVDFPNRAQEKSAAASSLMVVADKLKRDMGIEL